MAQTDRIRSTVRPVGVCDRVRTCTQQTHLGHRPQKTGPTRSPFWPLSRADGEPNCAVFSLLSVECSASGLVGCHHTAVSRTNASYTVRCKVFCCRAVCVLRLRWFWGGWVRLGGLWGGVFWVCLLSNRTLLWSVSSNAYERLYREYLLLF